MSTTLTNGLKLPDKGSVDWYADMQSNYTILDGAVGTIAEHTSALSGKAPLVHTHTKSDITDFPVYGTTAGTICEGNDSRLSDARTPVAHTHTKGDVTDLFNSANVWSNYNSYSKGIELAGSRYAYILPEFAANYSGISILTNSFGKSVKFGSYTVDENSVVSLDTTLGFFEIYAGYANDVNTVRINPRNAAVAELGTSNYKWKTLNGINPGALSLPDISKYDNVTSQVQPPAGESALNIQGVANTWTASADGYLVYMGRYNHFSQVYLYVANTYIGAQMASDSNSSPLYRFISVPVCKNQIVQIMVYGTQFNGVYFYPNLGNV